VDKVALKRLAEEYNAADRAIQDAEAAVVLAVQRRSDIVEKMAQAAGGKNKLRMDGQEVTIVSKKNNKLDRNTFYLRGKTRAEDAIEI